MTEICCSSPQFKQVMFTDGKTLNVPFAETQEEFKTRFLMHLRVYCKGMRDFFKSVHDDKIRHIENAAVKSFEKGTSPCGVFTVLNLVSEHLIGDEFEGFKKFVQTVKENNKTNKRKVNEVKVPETPAKRPAP
jgi:hypothetical protein